MSKKICLITDHHICVNPRLWKVAFFYEAQGFEVVVLSMWQSADFLQRDFHLLKGHSIVYKPYLNLIPGQIHPAARFFYRLRKRMASELQKWLNIGTGWAISHAPERMLRFALKEQADLYAAHMECAFFAGRNLVKQGKKVSFDFEDWYSQDYLSAMRPVKLLSSLEQFALKNGLFSTAASEEMAIALQKTYSCDKKITIIYNSFPDAIEVGDNPEVSENEQTRIIWTSRTVGPGRGLEAFVQALQEVSRPIDLHLIGQPVAGYKEELQATWPSQKGHRLSFVDFLNHDELMQMIPTFDIGLALEKNQPANKNKTVSNKILQYLQSGIKVLATDTDGQKEVASLFPNAVFLLSADNTSAWSAQIVRVLQLQESPTRKSEQQLIYSQSFSWEAQEKKLKQLVAEYL